MSERVDRLVYTNLLSEASHMTFSCKGKSIKKKRPQFHLGSLEKDPQKSERWGKIILLGKLSDQPKHDEENKKRDGLFL